MAPRKLSDSDKGSIVELYKQPGQTTSTLAEQYGVSNSTISRILKMSIPAEEYRALVSQKRMGGGAEATPTRGRSGRSRKSSAAKTAVSDPSDKALNDASERTHAVAPPKLKTNAPAAIEEDEQLPLLDTDEEAPTQSAPTQPIDDESDDEDDDDDDLLGLDETLGDDFGDDDLDDELDEDDDDLDDEETATPKPKLQLKSTMQIMPLGEAVLPKPCYLVIDMRSELITRPLVEFADLGQIPSEEERAKTLPVFDNHRVARRFSRNKQRVIKVPDGNLITRTSPYLAAKGITRLLVDGQVFDLASAGIET